MTYNTQRESLLMSHISALTKIDTLYQSRTSNFLNTMLGMNTQDVGSFMLSAFPTFIKPMQQQSAQLGFGMFLARRNMAASVAPTKPPAFNTVLQDLDLDSIFKKQEPRIGYLTSVVTEGVEAGDMSVIEGRFNQASSTMVTDVDREVVLNMSDSDPYSMGSVRAVRPDGCNFCKRVTINAGYSEGDIQFHNNCRCVMDASFEDEIKFRQAFYGDFKEQEQKARELIESGELGFRTIQVGSQDWQNSVDRIVAKKAREYRKNVFEPAHKEYTPEQIVAQRRKTNETAQGLSEKMADVAKGKAAFTEKERNILQSWKFDDEELKELYEPRYAQINTLTGKNMDIALDIVSGKRKKGADVLQKINEKHEH